MKQLQNRTQDRIFAGKYLRVFPIRIKLAPNEAQTVKVQITKTNELMPGEYRSHLYFRRVPNDNQFGRKRSSQRFFNFCKTGTCVWNFSSRNYSYCELTAKLNFSNMSFQMENDSTPLLKTTFNRSGNMSLYGNVLVNYISSTVK